MRFEERYERMRRLRPTARQVYALAVELCESQGESFPETAAEAADLIERLREANGHPAPRLEEHSAPAGAGVDARRAAPSAHAVDAVRRGGAGDRLTV